MLEAVIFTFVIGYLAIVFEHPLKLDKTVPALVMASLCWALISLGDLTLFDHHMNPVDLHKGDHDHALHRLAGAPPEVDDCRTLSRTLSLITISEKSETG